MSIHITKYILYALYQKLSSPRLKGKCTCSNNSFGSWYRKLNKKEPLHSFSRQRIRIFGWILTFQAHIMRKLCLLNLTPMKHRKERDEERNNGFVNAW